MSKPIKITVEEQIKIDTLSISDDLELFRVIGVNNKTISVDKNDNVLVGTDQGLIQKIGSNWHHYLDGLIEPVIQSIAVDRNNVIYIGYEISNGISKQNVNGWETIEMDNSLGGDVHEITFDINNNLWAATHYGIILKYQNNSWIQFENQPMKFHHPNSLFFEDNQILWGGCEFGCFSFDGQNWKLIEFGDGLLKAFSFTIDNEGTIWSLYQEALYKKSYSEEKIYTKADCEYCNFYPYSITVDLNNNLLMGSINGIIKFDGNNWKLLSLPFEDKNIYDIKVDSKNYIWFCTKSYFGIYKTH